VPGSETIRAFGFWGIRAHDHRRRLCPPWSGRDGTAAGRVRGQIEATRAEPGCLHYSFAADLVDPDIMRITEKWENPEALEAHFKSPHMAAFNAAFQTANVLAIKVDAYTAEHSRTLLG
jgi:quinol monooxygenase YgiN